MNNFKLTIAYDGGRYNGWQRQKASPNTVQGKLEAVLGELFGHKIEINGSGRTDAGVHALAQVASFAAETSLTAAEIRAYLNRYLPDDIAVTEAEAAPPRFHARLNAVGKTYIYRLWTGDCPNVFERKYVFDAGPVPFVGEMRAAAAGLLGRHDFIGFSSLKKAKKSTVRELRAIAVDELGGEVRLTLTADGFLYNMARIISGTLLEVGRGERSAESAALPLTTLDRADAGPTLPACGLTLARVEY